MEQYNAMLRGLISVLNTRFGEYDAFQDREFRKVVLEVFTERKMTTDQFIYLSSLTDSGVAEGIQKAYTKEGINV